MENNGIVCSFSASYYLPKLETVDYSRGPWPSTNLYSGAVQVKINKTLGCEGNY